MSETLEEAVLAIIKARKGIIPLQDIYSVMEAHPLVTPHHGELWAGRPKYQHWILSALAKLKQSGAIRSAGRGLYISN